jgi:hypothetical protein
VLVHAATDDGLYTVADDGTAALVVPGAIDALALGPDGSRWVVVDEHDVLVVRGDGVEHVDHSGERLTAIAATKDDVFVGTIGAHVMHLVEGGTLARVETFEELDGRDDWVQPWGAPGDVRSITTDGRDTVWVNVHVGGVLRTQDGGEQWVQTIDHEVDVHQVVRAPDGRLFVATGAAGLARSDDDGATWEYTTAGLHGTYARAVAPVDGGVLVSASTGPFTHEGAVYRLADGAATFERCDDGVPARFDGNVDSHWIGSAGTTAVLVAPDATLYRSDDAGATWRVLTAELPQARALLVQP